MQIESFITRLAWTTTNGVARLVRRRATRQYLRSHGLGQERAGWTKVGAGILDYGRPDLRMDRSGASPCKRSILYSYSRQSIAFVVKGIRPSSSIPSSFARFAKNDSILFFATSTERFFDSSVYQVRT